MGMPLAQQGEEAFQVERGDLLFPCTGSEELVIADDGEGGAGCLDPVQDVLIGCFSGKGVGDGEGALVGEAALAAAHLGAVEDEGPFEGEGEEFLLERVDDGLPLLLQGLGGVGEEKEKVVPIDEVVHRAYC